MTIVHSSISCASACGGNKACETMRFRRKTSKRAEGDLCNSEDASPNPERGELDSASLRYMLAANLPEMAKPATSREEMNVSAYWVSRGGWRERVSREYSWYPGYPSRCTSLVVKDVQRLRGSHNPLYLRRRKSEQPIVVMTQGNACRAKGLCRYRVFKIKGGSA